MGPWLFTWCDFPSPCPFFLTNHLSAIVLVSNFFDLEMLVDIYTIIFLSCSNTFSNFSQNNLLCIKSNSPFNWGSAGTQASQVGGYSLWEKLGFEIVRKPNPPPPPGLRYNVNKWIGSNKTLQDEWTASGNRNTFMRFLPLKTSALRSSLFLLFHPKILIAGMF